MDALKPLIDAHPDATIIFTGHSLGAAQTTFAAVDVKERLNPPNPIMLYTFGSPRPGNQVFSDYVMSLFPEAIQRVVHYTDIVPHLPMTEVGFNHAGNEIWYTGADLSLDYKICRNKIGQPESEDCANTVSSWDASQHM